MGVYYINCIFIRDLEARNMVNLPTVSVPLFSTRLDFEEVCAELGVETIGTSVILDSLEQPEVFVARVLQILRWEENLQKRVNIDEEVELVKAFVKSGLPGMY